MFKKKATFEIKIGERLYQIICEEDSPIIELIDVLNIVIKNSQQLLDDIEKKSKEEPETLPEE